MLSEIHNHWKSAEAVRIKCQGVPTVDMDNICYQLEVLCYVLITITEDQLLIYHNDGFRLDGFTVVIDRVIHKIILMFLCKIFFYP